jgi:putative transposase
MGIAIERTAPAGAKEPFGQMAHTFSNLLVHIVFSTKDRVPSINPEWRSELHAYMGGIVRELAGKVNVINGTADHVHLLASMPANLSVAEIVRVLKANSSRWVNRKYRLKNAFAWQTGYAAYSVSQSNAGAVAKYIQEQEKHHHRITFQEEYLEFLKRNGIEYDERFIWG